MATLTVGITETLSLGGYAKGWATVKNMENLTVEYCVERIVTATTTEVSLMEFASDLTSLGSSGSLCGVFDVDKVRYIRIYNSNDTNYITLKFKNSVGDEYAVKLDHEQPYIIFPHQTGGLASYMDANQTELGTFTDSTCDFTASSTTGTCDASAKIKVGQVLNATNVPNRTITAVNTPGAVTSFTMSGVANDNGTNLTGTFSGPAFSNLTNITVTASTGTCDLDVFVASAS